MTKAIVDKEVEIFFSYLVKFKNRESLLYFDIFNLILNFPISTGQMEIKPMIIRWHSLYVEIYFIFLIFNLNAQNLYSGSVVDQNNDVVIGASVFLENSTRGTQTDFDGKFIINAKINDVLIITYVGFEKQKLNLTFKRELGTITLRENIDELNEVVVVGYGNQIKEMLTSSVSSVDGDDLLIEPIINATQALQGKAAGIQIIASDAPGVGSQVIIRGLGTIQGGREPYML